MNILKWYTIIIVSITIIAGIICTIIEDDLEERLVCSISTILLIPTLIYFILS